MRLWMAAALAAIAMASAPPASAQLAGRSAEEWLATLDNPTRIQGLRVPEVVAAMKIRPGDTVADIGAGTGAFEQALSAAVGPTGKVYAQDVDKGLVDAIAKRAAEFDLDNVVTVLGGFTDPRLPTKDVDLAMIHDVLHHVEERQVFLRNLATYIRPGGRVALIDFHPGAAHRDQPDLLIPKDEATALMRAVGLHPIEDVSLLSDKYFLIYEKR
jgi:ubiquinone/menaquinone biosynthesis C-methylase UbiE